MCRGVFSVHINSEIRFRNLFPVGHYFFGNGYFCSRAECHGRLSLCRIDTLDLHRIHFHVSVFGNIDDRGRVHYSRAVAVAFGKMLLNIFYLGIFA